MNKLWEVSASATTLRALIFTAGHFLIDIMVITQVAGASLEAATAASLVGPLANGMWFWTIDRIWSYKHASMETA